MRRRLIKFLKAVALRRAPGIGDGGGTEDCSPSGVSHPWNEDPDGEDIKRVGVVYPRFALSCMQFRKVLSCFGLHDLVPIHLICARVEDSTSGISIVYFLQLDAN